MQPRFASWLLLLPAMLVSACPAPPDATPAPGAMSSESPIPAGIATPSPAAPEVSPPPLVREAEAAALLAVYRLAAEGTTRWTARAATTSVGPDGKSETSGYEMAFERPETLAVVITASSKGTAPGTKVIYRGGDTAEVRSAIAFFPVRLTLPITDDRLVDAWQRTIRDTGPRQLHAVLTDPGVRAGYAGEGAVAGEPMDLLDVRSPASWKEARREVVGLSRRSHLPIAGTVYDRFGRAVSTFELSGLAVDPVLPPTAFTLD